MKKISKHIKSTTATNNTASMVVHPVLHLSNSANLDDFIDFWNTQFDYLNMDIYHKAINASEITEDSLRKLFVWKNNMKLSDKKDNTFQSLVPNIPVINELKKQGFNQKQFDAAFEKISDIWKIFIMHIIAPDEFPIFDQHVYRAYRYMKELPKKELSVNKGEKLTCYETEYLPFYHQLSKKCDSKYLPKKLDNALWAFGKFLKTYPNIVK